MGRLFGKDPDAGKDWRQKEKRVTENEMIGWHHRFNGHEFESTPGVGDGQGCLACCSPWGRRVGHDWMTELNWTDTIYLPHGINSFSSLSRPTSVSCKWYRAGTVGFIFGYFSLDSWLTPGLVSLTLPWSMVTPALYIVNSFACLL